MSANVNERLAYLRARLLESCGRDPVIQPAALQVMLHDDTLVLTGMVPHAAAKERISDLARQLAPDLQIDNSCTVDAMAVPSPGELMDRAGDWMRHTFGDEAGEMGVMIGGGKAYLRGTWPTVAAVTQARQEIGRFPGIHSVDPSGVTLRHYTLLPEGNAVPLDGISVVNELARALATQGYRLGDWVEARNNHGTVELVGVVDDESAQRQVVEVTSRLTGVRRIIDHLVNRSGSRDAEARVEQRIRHAWARSGCRAAAPDLHLFVSGDQAFVQGTVNDPGLKTKALNVVQADPTIRRVIDFVRVASASGSPPKDQSRGG
ncbi:MAG: BON domain-containing protein [Candidatus Sericytochromatia bacterium]|nr:BON domain-containing protein [Candidatus Sericytochromatia bacterium]